MTCENLASEQFSDFRNKVDPSVSLKIFSNKYYGYTAWHCKNMFIVVCQVVLKNIAIMCSFSSLASSKLSNIPSQTLKIDL